MNDLSGEESVSMSDSIDISSQLARHYDATRKGFRLVHFQLVFYAAFWWFNQPGIPASRFLLHTIPSLAAYNVRLSDSVLYII